MAIVWDNSCYDPTATSSGATTSCSNYNDYEWGTIGPSTNISWFEVGPTPEETEQSRQLKLAISQNGKDDWWRSMVRTSPKLALVEGRLWNMHQAHIFLHPARFVAQRYCWLR